jgi:hypothetical protein
MELPGLVHHLDAGADLAFRKFADSLPEQRFLIGKHGQGRVRGQRLWHG